MKRIATPKKAAPKKAAPKKAAPKARRREWVQYLPAIITATTALLDLLLKHFKP